MNSSIIKFILVGCLIFQAGCDITFKRKIAKEKEAPALIDGKLQESKEVKAPKANPKNGFAESDSKLIKSYYLNKTNAVIRADMIMHTKISKQQTEKLIVDNYVPRDIQVMPLPLKLNRKLSAIPLDNLRVQVGTKIILMNVKTRKILDVIKI